MKISVIMRVIFCRGRITYKSYEIEMGSVSSVLWSAKQMSTHDRGEIPMRGGNWGFVPWLQLRWGIWGWDTVSESVTE